MIDLRKYQDKPEDLAELLRKRRITTVDISALGKLFAASKKARTEIERLRAERNTASKEIGALIGKGRKEEAEKRKEEVRVLGDQLSGLEAELEKLESSLQEEALGLPNDIDPEVPDGDDAAANKVVREVGRKRSYSFKPIPHYEIGEKMGILDFDRGVKLGGSRFYVYRGLSAALERALENFMLDLHTKEFGYTEMGVPELVNDVSMRTTGQYPKFAGDFYRLDQDGLSLVPTGEVPLTNLFREEILEESDLPVKITALTNCFRREAGAAGKDTRGLVRVHQFKKVELVQVAHPDRSEESHQAMLGHAEEVLKRLELPYRVLLLCSGDMGANMRKTYDLEVWMPGLDRWLEVSSISNAGDFQARRGLIRFRPKGPKEKPQLVHTLNGSGLALGRTMIAIMENYQKADGTFDIPAVLTKYL